MNAHELGLFIRTHREQRRPEDAGLRSIGRRRTPGLRREELAQLCGVSSTWITWLEQGRDVQASTATLEKLAKALQLTDAEQHYLLTLAGKTPVADALPTVNLSESLRQAVHQVAGPSYILDKAWNAIAWNTAAETLFTGWLDPAAPSRNLLIYTFLSPHAKALIHDWENRSQRLVAEFRADCVQQRQQPEIDQLITTLSAQSAKFNDDWKHYQVIEREGGERIFHHPDAGTLVYQQHTFYPAIRSDLKFVMLIPAAG
ncbi:helix-turn-helix transcriptional regulator [Leeia oryzae]|uniref:helix-turn-helix transcriptional regulator n=1 Tax=Leeia oryzae TaxID=356662 RepID=UPI00038271CE|nr:helix-turn-helix transcriptional regulator [Leeia oryzae]